MHAEILNFTPYLDLETSALPRRGPKVVVLLLTDILLSSSMRRYRTRLTG